MELDAEAIATLCGQLPESLPALQAALTTGAPTAGPRVWLPPIPEPTTDTHRVWEGVVTAVARFIPDGGYVEQHGALKVLALCPIQRSAELAELALAGKPKYAIAACDALARSGGVRARAHLERSLRHESSLVRIHAAANLGVLGDAGALPALEAVFGFETEEPQVLVWAAMSIAELGGAKERKLLERLQATQRHPEVRLGLSRALDLVPVAESPSQGTVSLTGLDMLEQGDDAGLDWLCDRYGDADDGLAVRIAFAQMPEATLSGLVARLAAGPVPRQLAAADVLGWRGVSSAVPALKQLAGHYDPALALVAGCSLVRLGIEGAAEELATRWLQNFDPQDRVGAARSALLFELPVPDPIVKLLLDDPCALLAPFAAELLRREPSPTRQGWLLSALDLERARLTGDADARDPGQHDRWVMSASVLTRYLDDGAPRRAQLPSPLRESVTTMERDERDPHVIAAHSLLHALASVPPDIALPQLAPWLSMESPMLRFVALKLWVALSGAVPESPSLASDPSDAVRGLWEELG